MPYNLTDEQLAAKAKKDPQARNVLLGRYRPLVERRSQMYRGVAVPQPAIYGEGLRLIQYAAETFKPGKGAQFSTHAENHLRRMSRYVNTHKNIARIPSAKHMRLGLFRSRTAALKLRLGREPAPEELADDLGWPVKDVVELMEVSRPELAQSGITQEQDAVFSDRMKETATFVRFELSSPEKIIFDYLHGMNGRPQETNVSLLAVRSGQSTDKVYRTIRKIRELMQRHL